MKREQKPEDIKKITSVWDYKGQPSIMAKDETLRRSQAATKSRRAGAQFPAHMQVFKEKR